MIDEMPLVDPPRIVFDEPSAAVAVWRQMIFSVWREEHASREVSARSTQQVIEAGKAMGAKKAAFVVMLHPNVVPPDAATREDMARAAPKIAAFSACSATIHTGKGFHSSVVRGVMTAFKLASRSSHPDKVFSSDLEASHWLASQMKPTGMSFEGDAQILEVLRWVHENLKV